MAEAEQTGRVTCLLALDLWYCDVIARRYTELAGRAAPSGSWPRMPPERPENPPQATTTRHLHPQSARGQHRRSTADDQLLLALVCGATQGAAAAKAGLGVTTVRRRLQVPDFARRLRGPSRPTSWPAPPEL